MSVRDELAMLIGNLLADVGNGYSDMGDLTEAVLDGRYDLHVVAERLIAAGWMQPRTVTSEAELDALPVNSVVVDTSDVPRTKRYGDSHMGAGWTHAGRGPLRSYELVDGRPMTVVFTTEARS